MKRLQTHYDNLKVARDAPPEVIRAAYKTLSQKYHPDRNPGNSDAARIMTIINTSYAVLSDPVRRSEHDQWISAEERPTLKPTESTERGTESRRTERPHSAPRPWRSADAVDRIHIVARHIRNHWLPYLVSALLLYSGIGIYTERAEPPPPGPKPYTAVPPPAPEGMPASAAIPRKPPTPHTEAYQRPSLTPKGHPWPAKPSLLGGYPRLNVTGHSLLTVDNSQGGADVIAKLVWLGGAKAFPVRVFFLPAGAQYTLHSLTPGRYDLRYRDLDTGSLTRCDAFELTERTTATAEGEETIYSNSTLSIYKVPDGNAQSFPLAENEF